MIPGMYPKSVKRILIRTSLSHFSFSTNTPRGGRIMARMIFRMSEQVIAIFAGC